MNVFHRLGEPVINKTRRRSSIVVIPPMQICPGIVSLTFDDLPINYFIIQNLIIFFYRGSTRLQQSTHTEKQSIG